MKPLIGIVFVGCLAQVFGCLATLSEAVEIQEPDDLTLEQRNKYRGSKSMLDAFETLERRLLELAGGDSSAEANIEAAKTIELPKKKYGGLISSGEQRSFREALKLFVSLERVTECDLVGYETMAKIRLVLEGAKAKAKAKAAATANTALGMQRIRSVLDEYRRRHANRCRRQHNNWIKKELTKLEPLELDRLNKLLKVPLYELVAHDSRGERLPDSIKLIAEPEISLSANNYELISHNIFKTVAIDLALRPKAVDLDDIYNQYVWRPCETFYRQLGPLLAVARFDAAYEDEQQLQFLTESQELVDAIIKQRICNFILLEHPKEAQKGIMRFINKYRDDGVL